MQLEAVMCPHCLSANCHVFYNVGGTDFSIWGYKCDDCGREFTNVSFLGWTGGSRAWNDVSRYEHAVAARDRVRALVQDLKVEDA